MTMALPEPPGLGNNSNALIPLARRMARMEIYQGRQDATEAESSYGIDLVIEHLDEFAADRPTICQLTNADYVVYAAAS